MGSERNGLEKRVEQVNVTGFTLYSKRAAAYSQLRNPWYCRVQNTTPISLVTANQLSSSMNNHAPLVLSDMESREWPVKTEKQGGRYYHGATALR
jgi:hypothetical protein